MPHTRPAQASRALRPAGLLNRPRRPLSRGSSPVSCPTKPLVSYRSNRQLSGWNPPPLVIRAVGAHGEIRVNDWLTAPCIENVRRAQPLPLRALMGAGQRLQGYAASLRLLCFADPNQPRPLYLGGAEDPVLDAPYDGLRCGPVQAGPRHRLSPVGLFGSHRLTSPTGTGVHPGVMGIWQLR